MDRIAFGGIGDIWTGVHAAQEVPVAIKVMKHGYVDGSYAHNVFRREAQAVARLSHPGIITLFDVGEIAAETADASAGMMEVGSPYLVMEYLPRGSLEALSYPLKWYQAREILIAMLDGLAHAHARGITHRDLKPGNVLLAEGGSGYPIRLTDFGLAFPYRENPPSEADEMAVGTPSYMAPEQFMAEWRDYRPWTDLYALGCVAYELASGHVPFRQSELVRLGMAHIEEPPPPLVCPPDFPPGFDTWVMKLLQKDPLSRYRRCSEAANALVALGATDSAVVADESDSSGATDQTLTTTAITPGIDRAGRGTSWSTPAPPSRPFKLIGAGLSLFELRTVPMVNRDAERDLMWQMLRRVSQRREPAVVVLEGPAGTGKSRLAEWLCQRAHEMGLADYVMAEHTRTRSGESELSHMLASAWSCLGSSADELQERVATIINWAGAASPAMHKAVAELLAPSALGDAYSPGMFSEFRNPLERFDTLYETLRRVYSDRALVVWLDDVQWGADALRFTGYALDRSRTESVPILFVLTARDDLLTELVDASNLIQDLGDREPAQHIHIGPLSDSDSRLLANSLLHLEADLADRVSARSAGNPLYATQLVGDWVSRGVLRAGRTGFLLADSITPDIPDDIHAVWVQRLERLLDDSTIGISSSVTPDVQRIQLQVELELAAALGGRIDMEEWAALCSSAGVPDPSHTLEVLLSRRMARMDEAGWSFSHSMLRDAIERIAREKGRWQSHNRRCADMLEQRRSVPNWGDSERIGRHRFAAAQFQSAVSPLLRGARERKRLEEYSVALELLGLQARALDELGAPLDDPQRLDGWLLRADINSTRRETETAEELANRIMALSDSTPTRRFKGAALMILARTHRYLGRVRSALRDYAEAQQILHETGPTSTLAACLSEQARAMLDADLLAPAWESFNEAQKIYEETHQLLPWAENQLGLARVAMRQGDHTLATTLCRRVQAFAHREDLSRIESDAWLVRAEVQVELAQWNDAEASLDRSIELLEQLGLTGQTYHPRLLKTLLLLESGSLDRAQLEFVSLRSSPDVENPSVRSLLTYCVGLAFAVQRSARDFQSGLAAVTALLNNTEVLVPEVVRCLLLVSRLARSLDLPERATQVAQIARATAARLGNEELEARFS